eukprot:5380044-Heterocapsa_arctica.AAC.1
MKPWSEASPPVAEEVVPEVVVPEVVPEVLRCSVVSLRRAYSGVHASPRVTFRAPDRCGALRFVATRFTQSSSSSPR